MLLLMGLSVVADELSWRVRFGLFTTDSLYHDDFNLAGVIEDASRERDIYDSEQMFPPTSNYAIMFFPHRDISEPDYWPPPYNKDYCHDFRPPLDAKEIWYIKFTMVYTSARQVTVWWREMNDMPPSYLPLFISEGEDSFNMFEQSSFTRLFSPGIHRWRFSVEPEYYSSFAIRPSGVILTSGETAEFGFYVYSPPDSTICLSATFEFIGTGGSIDESGLFRATHSGSGIVVARQGGHADTAEVTILPASGYSIPFFRGWNLISLPCIPPETDVAEALPWVAGNIYSYDNHLGMYIEADSLFPGIGYFALSTRDTTIFIDGESLDSLHMGVFRGWNMLGGPSNTAHFEDISSTPSGVIHGLPQVWSWFYSETDSILNYQGFWLLCGADGTISIITD